MTKKEYEILKLQQHKAELTGKIDALTIRRDEIERKLMQLSTYSTRQFIANEISQFLQDAGFEEASKAIDCEYEL